MAMIYAILIFLILTISTYSQTRITNDHGGSLAEYAERAQTMGRVEIDGVCNSACTLFLAQACVTPRAVIGFHSARDYLGMYVTGRPRMGANNEMGNLLMMQSYPLAVKQWVKEHGGLRREMIYLRGGELLKVMPRCK